MEEEELPHEIVIAKPLKPKDLHLPSYDLNSSVSTSDGVPADMVERRNQMMQKHYGGHSGLIEKLKYLGTNELKHIVLALCEEILQESDHLAGNSLIALEEGNLAASSAISAKRAEVIEKAMKALQTKEMFERERGIDVESPSMEVVFTYFLEKCKNALDETGIDQHVQFLFVKSLTYLMENWKKELKTALEQIHSLGTTNKRRFQ